MSTEPPRRHHDCFVEPSPNHDNPPLIGGNSRQYYSSNVGNQQERAHLLLAALPLALPVTSGYTTASRSTALAFSVMIQFAMKNYALVYCFRHSPTSSAALICWSVLIPKPLRSSTPARKRHSLRFLRTPRATAERCRLMNRKQRSDTRCHELKHFEGRQMASSF